MMGTMGAPKLDYYRLYSSNKFQKLLKFISKYNQHHEWYRDNDYQKGILIFKEDFNRLIMEIRINCKGKKLLGKKLIF